ncbi:hypothetical protein KUV22_02545 [Microbulbifer agarilyticus]|uniref:hypothetical protein n=1 Tax=Microbulbifer agarilyticus TaxID=260552 RepID=UPI001C96E9D2|nr:hypothetical protein [Microbulbifer agarilyticus]MBY6189287.1 hypothetical protein [Microbulbifer agarilyticus]
MYFGDRQDMAFRYAKHQNRSWMRLNGHKIREFALYDEEPISGGRKGPRGRPKYLSFRRNSTGTMYWLYRPPWLANPVSLGRDENAATEYVKKANQQRDRWLQEKEERLSQCILNRISRREKGAFAPISFRALISDFGTALRRTMPKGAYRLEVKPKLAIYIHHLGRMAVDEVDVDMLRLNIEMSVFREEIYKKHRKLLVKIFDYAYGRGYLGRELSNQARRLPSTLDEMLK